MIQYINGNLLESSAEALVNTVNTVGIMGKGIALQFKTQFPHNYKSYAKSCKENAFQIGQLLIIKDSSLLYGEKIIINFPTKTDWRKPSEYEYIEKGLQALVQFIEEKNLKSIAIPPLGAGNGGLDWHKIQVLLENYLSPLDCTIFIYTPNSIVQDVLRKERVSLTPARAMLLAVLYDLVSNGEFVSEFASEKIGYFLQRFGAKSILKLDYQPNFYGPYSGKMKHVLYYLNGSYLTGYSSKDKKPFEELNLLMHTEPDVLAFLAQKEYAVEHEIVEKTKTFLSGFYSNFGLELLSTLDFITQEVQTKDINIIKMYLEQWNPRKTKLFSNDVFLDKGLQKLKQTTFV